MDEFGRGAHRIDFIRAEKGILARQHHPAVSSGCAMTCNVHHAIRPLEQCVDDGLCVVLVHQRADLVHSDAAALSLELLGHGVESFTGLFPFYQRLTLDDNVVLHPESSWLQWLCELGLIPVAILAVLLGRLVFLLKSPVQRLVTVLRAPLRDLVLVLKQIEK